MQIPKKISPDQIKNSIVEIKYTTGIPFEILLGNIFDALDDTFKYTNRPAPFGNNQIIDGSFQIGLGGQNLFYTDTLKLELRPNSLIFNCLSHYAGWSNYMAEIKKALSQIMKIKKIDSIFRIGLRYINEYPDMDIQNCTKFNFTFGIPAIQSETYQFRTEFILDNYKVILNLQNKTPLINPPSNGVISGIKQISIVDIDVIAENLAITALDMLFAEIENIHNKEKEIFFNIIKEEYLQTLNAIYE